MPKERKRITFSDDDRRRIAQVRNEVNNEVGFTDETDADHGYKAAYVFMQRPNDPDTYLTTSWMAVQAFQGDSLRHNSSKKRQREASMRRARNRVALAFDLWKYPVTGPNNTRQTVREIIDTRDEDAVLRAIQHIIGNIRGLYEPLSVYLWTLACLDHLKAGGTEATFPVYLPLTQEEVDKDLITVLMGRYQNDDADDDVA
jgi:hypothetical protein